MNARAAATTTSTVTTKHEIAAILIGEYRNGIWHARLNWRTHGDVVSVEFDWKKVLDREEEKGDVVGFFHTHPDGFSSFSSRDVRTMQSWCNCFGKPLLCLIECESITRAWVFNADSDPVELRSLTRFRNNWLVAVE